MITKVFSLSIVGTFLACAALAGPQNKPAPKVVVLHTCPITGEAITGAGTGSEKVGNYKVSFCCAGCQPKFDAMSKKDKEKKLAEIAKKEAAKKKS